MYRTLSNLNLPGHTNIETNADFFPLTLLISQLETKTLRERIWFIINHQLPTETKIINQDKYK